jgi:hypothetical protein
VEVAQARALAVSGLEDLRVKLAKDPFFPTGIGDEQVIFTYTETVTTLSSPPTKVGSFQVTVDRSHRDLPDKVLRLESVGIVGGYHAEAPRFAIYAELDLRDFSFKVWQEGAASSL